jgi:hypothetical protein
MENTNITDPIPPIRGDIGLNSYYCPYCTKLLFKGNIKKLNMVCHHCQKLITATGPDLLKSHEDAKTTL